jgi:hypothetical protein
MLTDSNQYLDLKYPYDLDLRSKAILSRLVPRDLPEETDTY